MCLIFGTGQMVDCVIDPCAVMTVAAAAASDVLVGAVAAHATGAATAVLCRTITMTRR